MEIVIAVFISVWLSTFAFCGYLKLKKDYKNVDIRSTDKGGEDNR